MRLAQTCWRPAADVYETASTIAVTVDLAGVDHEALDVLLYEDALIVEGQRRLRPAEAGGVYQTAEIRQGPFRLELALPAPIDSGKDAGSLKTSAETLWQKLSAVESELMQPRNEADQDTENFPTKLDNQLAYLYMHLNFTDSPPTKSDKRVEGSRMATPSRSSCTPDRCHVADMASSRASCSW